MSISIPATVQVGAPVLEYGDRKRDSSAQPALPTVPNARPFDEPFLDTVGNFIHDHKYLLAGASVAGALIGAKLPAKSLTGTILHSALGLGILPVATALIGSKISGKSPALPPSKAYSPSDSNISGSRESLRVVSYNIREGIGPKADFGGNEADLDRIAEEIRGLDADIVMLQEVADNGPQSRLKDVAGELAERLHPTSFDVGWSGSRALGFRKGNAVMTFGDSRIEGAQVLRHDDSVGKDFVRRIGTLVHSVAGEKEGSPTRTMLVPRSTLDTIVTTPGGTQVRVLSGHYDGNKRAPLREGGTIDMQKLQFDSVLPTLAANRGIPTIFGADFNIESDTARGARETRLLASVGLVDAFTASGIAPDDARRKSIPAAKPRRPIDRIYTSESIAASNTRVITSDKPGSDHAIVVTDITL